MNRVVKFLEKKLNKEIMPILSLEIDNLKYEIECEEGEEKLLEGI